MNFALVAIGLVTLLGQVVLLRELLVAFFGSELIYVLALGFWLLGSGLGALFGRRRAAFGGGAPIAVAWLLIILGLMLPLDVVAIRAVRLLVGAVPGAYLEFSVQLILLAVALLPPSLLAGALLRVAAQAIVRRGGRFIRAYAVESSGGVLGGVLATAVVHFGLTNLLGALVAGFAAAVAGSLVAALGIPRGQSHRLACLAAGGFVAAVLAAGMVAHVPLDRRLSAWSQPNLVASRDTPYGRIAVTETAGQVALFEDGALVATSEETAAEDLVHMAVVQRERLDSALVLGFGSGSEVAQLLAYRLARIDWVVVDADVVRWVAGHLPAAVGRALADSTVRLIEADPRAWLEAAGRYDLILSSMPEPGSGRANRFWTVEYFTIAGEHLRPGGVLACWLKAADNVWTPSRLSRAASIYRALTSAFADAVVLPGMHTHLLLASDRRLTRDAAELAPRLARASPPPRYLTPAYLAYLYTSDRYERARELLTRADASVNRDAYPVCYRYTLMIWLSRFFPALTWRNVETAGPGARLWGTVLLAAAVVVALAARRRALGRRYLLAAVAGLAGMILEAVLLLHYQVHRGVLYQDLGFLFTAFMVGLACGGEALARVRDPGLRTQIALATGTALLGAGTAWLTISGWATGLAATAGLLVLAGALTAALLGLASRRDRPDEQRLAGPLLGADLLGGCCGTVAAALALVPLFGLPGAAFAVLALAGLVLLVA